MIVVIFVVQFREILSNPHFFDLEKKFKVDLKKKKIFA